MDIETIHEYCLSKKAATEDFPFDETTLVIRVMNRIFMMVDLENADKIVMKCDPDYAIELRDRYRGVEGAFHCNKKYWNQIFVESDVPDSLILSLIDHSYDEVIKKFTKKDKAIYDDLP